MNPNINVKIKKEQKLVECMIRIYCRGKHRHKKELCPQCKELLEYAHMRTSKCPFMETKTFCSACKVHCYKPEKREVIRKVMKYAGPRMLFVHPIMAIKHLIVTIKG